MGVIRSERHGLFPGKHVPLVTKYVFERVQAVLAGKYVRRTKRFTFLFRRFIRCETCGRSLVGYWQGEAKTEKWSAPSTPNSTSVVLSQPTAASLSEAWHDERWCLRRKREILAGNVTPRYITMQPGQTSEWTSLSEHEDRRKTWFVMTDGKVRETIRFWDDTYAQYQLNPTNTARDEWNTPAKDARWGAWKNEDSKPVTMRLWIFD
jgi:hypothetical protein